jgi:hypothetical protein
LKFAEGPLPPAPAQVVQLDQPVIFWMLDFTIAVPGTGVPGGGGAVEPLTVMVSGNLKIPPAESHACTTTPWVPLDIGMLVFRLPLPVTNTLLLST